MKLTGGQIVAKALKANGVDYVAGIPGDGSWSLVEALLTAGTDIPFIQIMLEQSGVHLADGYFRACGRPMAVLLAGPLGISKALGAIADAAAQSSAMLLISADDAEWDDDRLAATAGGVMKEYRRVSQIEQLPQALRQSFDTMFSGRVGPTSLDIPAAVQNVSIDVSLAPATLRPSGDVPRAGSRLKTVALRQGPAASRVDDSASGVLPLTAHRSLAALRSILEKEAILVVGAGSLRAIARQVFPLYHPGIRLCAANAGAQGWAVPAAIGAKLAMPARQVVCTVGGGDFLQSMQEMAVCVMHSIPVVFLVLNNSSQVSVSHVQTPALEQHRTGEFNLPDGKPYSPDFAGIARNFGLDAWRVEHASQLDSTFIKALNSKGPSLVEVMIARDSRANNDACGNHG
ncbi:thiamine pyrophosphate-dependent enzyme [Pseudomonas sp. NFACC13-1]|uniref:thiamine pyrophosphate-dependent enzyme n=1 Tax=Pseudomonas sp. NFACC13-1 TaxID=1566245 RepID=UPI00087E8B2C|nr:thiamine pyrophosphate-dependent enzyme [Pseudomonas sp. NFACC13-1]SDB40490.1 Thiamine pyrophosphate enzyme, C-terminal TPP binding domain [Pseudomonas sp. NFACC13-1]